MFSKQELLKVVEQIDFLAQKDVLDIPFLTHNAAFNIVTQNPLKVSETRFCIIFSVTSQDLSMMRGFGEKTAQRLIRKISVASTDVPFVRFLRAAGMNKLSESACTCIAKTFDSYDKFKSCKLVDGLKTLEKNGLGDNSMKVILSEAFWDDAELLRRFVTIA